jgi:putative transposase
LGSGDLCDSVPGLKPRAIHEAQAIHELPQPSGWGIKSKQTIFIIIKLSIMPFINIWVHLVWATKNMAPLLANGMRQQVFTHIKENGSKKGIHVDFVNGYIDHVHCLVSLTAEQTIAQIVQLLKGESSFWINKINLCKEHFDWQNDYFAVSVSESGVHAVREYIKNQEAHHTKKTFGEEYEAFVNKYGFVMMKG